MSCQHVRGSTRSTRLGKVFPPFPPPPTLSTQNLQSAFKFSFVFEECSLTTPAIPLNSEMPASPMHSYKKLSELVTIAPSARSLFNAIPISSGLQLWMETISTAVH